ncbi:unnamed protein product [Ixodes pacificus]
MYLRPGNYTIARDPWRDACELWRPFLLQKAKSTTPLPQTPSLPKTMNKKSPQNPHTTNQLTPQKDSLNSSASRELHLFSLVLSTVCLVASNLRL